MINDFSFFAAGSAARKNSVASLGIFQGQWESESIEFASRTLPSVHFSGRQLRARYGVGFWRCDAKKYGFIFDFY
ncbi:hypothetical protein [Methanolapillus africanus]|uniref:hypothetical protein n=1 Tax=Methanolapillus africanus TaxID=3028297 RepID=UPI0030B8E929